MSHATSKLVRNQLLFREVNERLRETVGSVPATVDFLCECSSEDCIDTVSLAADEYENVRSHSNLFVIAAGHERLEVERIVAQQDGYMLVEKTAETDAVIRTDPRQRTQ